MYGFSDGKITAVDDIAVVNVIGICVYTDGCPAILCSPLNQPNTLLLLVGPSELMSILCVRVYVCACVCVCVCM